MSQIGLPFDWQEQGGQGQFIVGDANRLALDHIERWRDWPIPISILSGPPRSGKSALGRHFAGLSGGVVMDDANRQPNETLFHQWNIARDTGVPLLLIAREAPELWTVALPDLRSRLAAAPHVRIAEPDDALMLSLIETGLAAAGSAYAPDVPEWLARRIERSYAALASTLDVLNRASLASARKISVASAKEALQNSHLFPIERDETGQGHS
ncbi:chromosomal replication initiator DnaA [Sphingobium sp. DEHP117]|uniref:HdaA/DnaA family protein n=1 Tax=Sphingobium sp. DEHP117 TaxID=2993436 RepID=UPI0027D667A3|nr:chromosomal replication initiator DnaA [Sphingobium sp. DEHP117]MDQ4419610.1 chromosomal replication initiator DnaA [Sphingobium sp. DEHP117]